MATTGDFITATDNVPLSVGKAQEDVREAYRQALSDAIQDKTPKTGKLTPTRHEALNDAFERASKGSSNTGQIWGMGDDSDDSNVDAIDKQ